jgi:hypothetical protein
MHEGADAATASFAAQADIWAALNKRILTEG